MTNEQNNGTGRVARRLMRTAAAGTLAMALLGATTGTAALQDIAEMTGTRTSMEGRWLARLVAVPRGSVHVSGTTAGAVTHAMAIETFEGRTMLDPARLPASGRPQTIDRTLKGDGVNLALVPVPVLDVVAKAVEDTSSQVRVAGLTTPLYAKPILIPESYKATVLPEPEVETDADPLTPLARAIRPSDTVDGDDTDGARAMSDDAMAHARSAARNVIRVMADLKKQAETNSAPISLAAYAPQDKPMANAFSALLGKTTTERPRPIIQLSRGDHKWAAKSLPETAHGSEARRCLANGVYFEARGESLEGQRAVAQVILNRVKNPAYPNTICGVVYQNKHMRNACQFSFACDGIRDRVSAGKHWKTAQKVASDAINGTVWLKSVGSSSHYHADYVAPRWRRSMKRMVKIGRHIFYRTYGGGWS